MAIDNIVVGLDIGTSKIAVIIGNTWQGDPEKIEIRGVGTAMRNCCRFGVRRHDRLFVFCVVVPWRPA